jgi:hypothetical protein
MVSMRRAALRLPAVEVSGSRVRPSAKSEADQPKDEKNRGSYPEQVCRKPQTEEQKDQQKGKQYEHRTTSKEEVVWIDPSRLGIVQTSIGRLRPTLSG